MKFSLSFPSRIALGLAVISFAITFLSYTGLLKINIIILCSILIFLLLCIKRLPNIFLNIQKSIQTIKFLSLSNNILISLIAINSFIIFLNCFCPPIARDAVNYHLFLPKLWLQNHGIIYSWENIYTFFPHFWENIYAYALAMGSDRTPTLLHFMTLILSASIIIKIMKNILEVPDKYCLIGALIFISTPSVMLNASCAYVDIAATFYLLAALYHMLNAEKKLCLKEFFLSAFFLGIAASIKYTAMLWLILFIPLIGVRKYFSPNNILVYCFISLLPPAPHLIHNYILSANPFFPLFNNIFHSPYLDDIKSMLYAGLAQSYGYGNTLYDLITSPLRLILSSQMNIPQRFDGIIGFTYLFTLCVIFIRKKPFSFLKNIAPVLLLSYIIWFFTSQQIRFLFFPLAVLAIIIASSAAQINKKFLNTLIILISLTNCYYPVKDALETKKYTVLAGRCTEEKFLSHNIPAYPIIQTCNKLNLTGKKILLLNIGNGAYYFKNPIFQESLFEDYTFLTLLKQGDTATINFLRRNNILYILSDNTWMQPKTPRYFPESYLCYNRFRLRYLTPITEQNDYILYKINF